VPLFNGQAFLGARNVGQNCCQTLEAGFGEGKSHSDGVYDPAQDCFGSFPAGITFEEFGDRDGLFAMRAIITC
jgi:hypothetical protein